MEGVERFEAGRGMVEDVELMTDGERPWDERIAGGMDLAGHVSGGPLGGVLQAASGGYLLGRALDERFQLSDHLSDAMVGSVDDQIEAQGMVTQETRGTAGIEGADRRLAQRALLGGVGDVTASARQALFHHWVR